MKNLFLFFVVFLFVPNFAISASKTTLDQRKLERWLIEKPKYLLTYLSQLSKDNLSQKDQEIALTYQAETLYFQDKLIELNNLIKTCDTNFINKKLNVRVVTVKSHSLYLLDKNSEAMNCINKVDNLMISGQPQGWEDLWALSVKVLILSKTIKKDESKALLAKLPRYIDSLKDNFRKANILEPLSMTYPYFNETDKGIKHQQKVIDIYLKLNLIEQLSVAYFNKGFLLEINKQYEKALQAGKKSLNYAQQSNNTVNQLFSVGFIAKIYLKTEQYQKGFDIIEKTLIKDRNIPPHLMISLLYERVKLLKKVGDTNQLISTSLKIIDLSDKHQLSTAAITQTRIMLAAIYAEKKSYKKAYNLLLTTMDI